MYRRFLSLFLALLLIFPFGGIRASAVDVGFSYSTVDFASMLVDATRETTDLASDAFDFFAGLFDNDYCENSPNHFHDFILQNTQFDGVTGTLYVCRYCNTLADGAFQTAYDEYAFTLDTPVVSDITSDFATVRLGTNISNAYIDVDGSSYYVITSCSGSRIEVLGTTNVGSFVDLVVQMEPFTWNYLTGEYSLDWSFHSDGFFHSRIGQPPIVPYYVGVYSVDDGDFLFNYSRIGDDSGFVNSGVNVELVSGNTYYLQFRFHPDSSWLYRQTGYISFSDISVSGVYVGGGGFEPGSGAGRPGSETRVGSLMQTINQYNSYDYSTKYYIGTVDNSNNVTNVYAPNIFNEQTKVFTEPVTGQQYQCTGWKYGYTSAARGYRLDLAEDTYNYNGTDIRTVCLFYLDDALYIVGLNQVYDEYFSDVSTVEDFFLNASFVQKYSYVIAEAGGVSGACQHVYTSETVTAPTCLDQGVRRYTCELCGHTRDEYIPAAGHAWEATEVVETEVDGNGDVIKLGYTVYTCSVCGETYKEYDDTGQPDEPSGGGSDDEGWLSWLGGLFRILISSIVNGLASGLEYLVDKVIVTVTDLMIQTIQWVMDLLNIDHLTGFFSWFSDGNEVFQEEFGQDTEEAEVDVWAYS